VDFSHLQKTEPVGTVINKGGLQSRFYPDHNRLVDIAPGLFPADDFYFQFGESAIVNDNSAVFLRMGGVDQHLLAHNVLSDPPSGASQWVVGGGKESGRDVRDQVMAGCHTVFRCYAESDIAPALSLGFP
jgi:hypothetical protein